MREIFMSGSMGAPDQRVPVSDGQPITYTALLFRAKLSFRPMLGR
jgi:hypothetical protein